MLYFLLALLSTLTLAYTRDVTLRPFATEYIYIKNVQETLRVYSSKLHYLQFFFVKVYYLNYYYKIKNN